MRFNPNNSFFQFTNTATQFISLQFIFIFFCLPVITIGWSVSALYSVMLKFADDERGYLIRGYFDALKQQFMKPTLLFFITGLPFILLVSSSVFWFSLETIISTIVGLFAVITALYFYVVLHYSLALTARYNNDLKQALKNAFLLPIAEPIISLGIALINVAFLSFIILFPAFRIFFILLGFTFTFYCQSFLILAVFKRH